MRMFAICDNTDTWTGLRLVGIEGVVLHEQEEVADALRRAAGDKRIGIILITEKLKHLCNDVVTDLMEKQMQPLILEIPDRHGFGRAGGSVNDYIRSSIGVKI